jgi:transposase
MALEQSSARQSEKTDSRSTWVNELRQRRGYNRATVAVANKNARAIWAVLTSGEPYRTAA